jgi:hypothetical protein
MPIGPRKLLPAAVLALLAAVAAAPGALARATAQAAAAPAGGVNILGLSYGSTPAQADQAIALASRLHARVVRTELPWAVLEPLAPGRLDPQALAFTDKLMADAAAAGIKVILTVRSTPCWQSSAPAALLAKCSPTELTTANAWPPREPASYGAFVAFLARRYGPQLAAIEVWNEPDQANELYFAGPEKATRYAAVLRAAYPAIKQADPSVAVIAGSLVGSNGAFLNALYAAGIKGFYDGLAVHYYNLTLASVRAIHQVQLANGDGTPLWLDEFGWTSCFPRLRIQEEQGCVTPSVQALNIRNVYRSLAGARYVAAAVLFQLQDTSSEQFGVVTFGGVRKPAFASLAGVLGAPTGRISAVTLRLRRSGSHLIASGSGPVGDFMQLEAFNGRVLRYKALFVLDRFNRYSIALPRALGTRHLRVRVFQYWLGPGRAARRST